MSAGRKPPIMPPRNPLANGAAAIGKRPLLPYRQALAAMQDLKRLKKAGALKIGLLATMEAPARILLPINPRDHADHLHIGRNQPAERRTRRKIEEAHRRMEDEISAAQADTEPVAASPADNRPQPQPRGPGRYAGLKDGRPGEPSTP